jgi:hypothetical protein
MSVFVVVVVVAALVIPCIELTVEASLRRASKANPAAVAAKWWASQRMEAGPRALTEEESIRFQRCLARKITERLAFDDERELLLECKHGGPNMCLLLTEASSEAGIDEDVAWPPDYVGMSITTRSVAIRRGPWKPVEVLWTK